MSFAVFRILLECWKTWLGAPGWNDAQRPKNVSRSHLLSKAVAKTAATKTHRLDWKWMGKATFPPQQRICCKHSFTPSWLLHCLFRLSLGNHVPVSLKAISWLRCSGAVCTECCLPSFWCFKFNMLYLSRCSRWSACLMVSVSCCLLLSAGHTSLHSPF